MKIHTCISCKKPFDGIICKSCCVCNRDLWETCQAEPFGYSFKPKAAKMAAPGEIALGVELEYESSSQYACKHITSTINANIPFVYIKRDGSLQSRCAGEIVTVPACLEVQKYIWSTYFFSHGSVSKHFGIEAQRTCGMHVHIGRECLTETQIAKMYGFLNYRYNQEFLARIAGRVSDYARMAGYSRYSFGTFQCRKLLLYHGGSKYTALNLQPDRTVEVRIFRATLAKYRFFARLEFAHALATACAPGNGLRQCIKYEDFLSWLFAKKENYPYLCKYIKKTLN